MITRHLYKTDEGRCTALIQCKEQNTLRMKFEVLKLWGPWQQHDPEVKVGTIFWWTLIDFRDMCSTGVLTDFNLTTIQELDAKQEPEVTNTKPPKELQKEQKIEKNEEKTTISYFAPFKFQHTAETVKVYNMNYIGDVGIGIISKIETKMSRFGKPYSKFYMKIFGELTHFEISESEFKTLKPVFFTDFEYPIPEKIDGPATEAKS